MASIPFAKYSGCGNDFILIDNREKNLSLTPKTVASLCHRQLGIGADGIILLEKGTKAPYRMRIFNADGTEAEMCGNGLRCLAHFIYFKEQISPRFAIETMHATMDVSIHGTHVSIFMPPPAEACKLKELSIAGKKINVHAIDTGVPHAVLFVEDLHHPDVLASAPSIRHHAIFPKGTNVNYAKILSDNTIAVRTYERGVEAETLACGTGAVAVALTAASVHALPSPITIQTRSGECLKIEFGPQLIMTGPVVKTFEGQFT